VTLQRILIEVRSFAGRLDEGGETMGGSGIDHRALTTEDEHEMVFIGPGRTGFDE
jgi:hypothetical protein